MRPQIVRILTLLLLVLAGSPMLAQDGGSGPPPPTDPPPELPIDSSLTILIVLALVYGGYVAYKRWQPTNSRS